MTFVFFMTAIKTTTTTTTTSFLPKRFFAQALTVHRPHPQKSVSLPRATTSKTTRLYSAPTESSSSSSSSSESSATTAPTTTATIAASRLSRQDLSMDTRTLCNHMDVVMSHLQARRASEDTMHAVQQIVTIQEQRVLFIQERDAQLNIRKEASAKVGQLMKKMNSNTDNDDDDEGNAINMKQQQQQILLQQELEQVKLTSTRAAELAEQADATLMELETKQNDLLAGIPNLLDDLVPNGSDESQNQVVSTWGTIPTYDENDFVPLWHDDIAVKLGGYQAEAATKISGARFVALSGPVARLERALGNFFMDLHIHQHGYTEVSVPLIVGASALEGTSQLPKFKEDLFAITPDSHTCNGEAAYLIPTAEVPVTNLHRQSVLDESDLPISYVAWTPCFRAEAGSYGRDTKGLIRTHQFGKVELVKITTPEASNEEHETLTAHAEACLQALELPYRKVRLCSGDIGFAARMCYDLEVWLPGAGEYREISSCSNTGDFQAKRMGLRYRPAAATTASDQSDGKNSNKKRPKPVFCHTLNGSGLAVGRALVAVLENYQQRDGSVIVPKVLQPYMGGLEKIEPVS